MMPPSFLLLITAADVCLWLAGHSYDASNERPGILIFITAGGAEP